MILNHLSTRQAHENERMLISMTNNRSDKNRKLIFYFIHIGKLSQVFNYIITRDKVSIAVRLMTIAKNLLFLIRNH